MNRLDQEAIKNAVKHIEKKSIAFLRALVNIQSLSGREKNAIDFIKNHMIELGFENVSIDAMGNVMGSLGHGPEVIAFDGHIDTVEVGFLDNWQFDPFEGYEDDTYIYGRGVTDQEGGFVAALYGVYLANQLDYLKNHTVWVVGSIQEEDCDGLCWQHIIENKLIEPNYVILTEPTALGVYRGHRGRMEIKIEVFGRSAHGSAPERGDNAIYKMAAIVEDLEALNEKLKVDKFLGKGSLVVSEIKSMSPSRCAVADYACISIDRRLTQGESKDTALGEIQALKSVQNSMAKVSLYDYDKPSYRGHVIQTESYFPTWTVAEDFEPILKMVRAHETLHQEKASIDKWTFSTNGVTIMGKYGIPCLGYGPGYEDEAHAPNEKLEKEQFLKAIATITGFFKA